MTSIAQINDVVARINDYQATIASAVEEQTATTNEMSRNVAEAAARTRQIAEGMAQLAGSARLTTTGVDDAARAAAELAAMSDELQRLVGAFSL